MSAFSTGLYQHSLMSGLTECFFGNSSHWAGGCQNFKLVIVFGCPGQVNWWTCMTVGLSVPFCQLIIRNSKTKLAVFVIVVLYHNIYHHHIFFYIFTVNFTLTFITLRQKDEILTSNSEALSLWGSPLSTVASITRRSLVLVETSPIWRSTSRPSSRLWSTSWTWTSSSPCSRRARWRSWWGGWRGGWMDSKRLVPSPVQKRYSVRQEMLKGKMQAIMTLTIWVLLEKWQKSLQTSWLRKRWGASGSEDLDETVIFEDGVEDVVEYGTTMVVLPSRMNWAISVGYSMKISATMKVMMRSVSLRR